MPKEYLKTKRALMRKGISIKKAKKIAAIKYNKKHPGNPVTKNYDAKVKTKKKKGTSKKSFSSQMMKVHKIMGKKY